MVQDIAAARVLFDSKVPVVQLPCMGVVSHLATTGPELNYWLRNKNKLCDYLCRIAEEEAQMYDMGRFWSRVIWDVSAVAWLMGENMMLDRIEYSPIPTYDGLYSLNHGRHPIRYVYGINRDKIFEDLFTRLSGK